MVIRRKIINCFYLKFKIKSRIVNQNVVYSRQSVLIELELGFIIKKEGCIE